MPAPFPIRDDTAYDRALKLIEELWDAEPGTPDHDVFEIMATLASVYDKARRDKVLDPGDPIELIEFKLRELGLSQRELGRRLGWGSGRVSEVLNRKRPLTLRMVQQLSVALDLPAGALVHDLRSAPDQAEWVQVHRDVAELAATVAYTRGLTLNDVVNNVCRDNLAAANERAALVLASPPNQFSQALRLNA
ncbi:helix-turn-helix domain-containing protein [Myxococcota bacterium]|nr:helix-turn-helix domain-containing protein [Myxococcota bacterium]